MIHISLADVIATENLRPILDGKVPKSWRQGEIVTVVSDMEPRTVMAPWELDALVTVVAPAVEALLNELQEGSR